MPRTLVVGEIAPEFIGAAMERVRSGEHPTWCHHKWCSIQADGSGFHKSEPVVIRSEGEIGPSSVRLLLMASASIEEPVVHMETDHPADINKYCGVDIDEPELTVFSIKQASLLASAFSRLFSKLVLPARSRTRSGLDGTGLGRSLEDVASTS